MSTTSWTPNDYSNIITIGAAAVGSVMLILFKSRCKNIKLCCGAVECVRDKYRLVVKKNASLGAGAISSHSLS